MGNQHPGGRAPNAPDQPADLACLAWRGAAAPTRTTTPVDCGDAAAWLFATAAAPAGPSLLADALTEVVLNACQSANRAGWPRSAEPGAGHAALLNWLVHGHGAAVLSFAEGAATPHPTSHGDWRTVGLVPSPPDDTNPFQPSSRPAGTVTVTAVALWWKQDGHGAGGGDPVADRARAIRTVLACCADPPVVATKRLSAARKPAAAVVVELGPGQPAPRGAAVAVRTTPDGWVVVWDRRANDDSGAADATTTMTMTDRLAQALFGARDDDDDGRQQRGTWTGDDGGAGGCDDGSGDEESDADPDAECDAAVVERISDLAAVTVDVTSDDGATGPRPPSTWSLRVFVGEWCATDHSVPAVVDGRPAEPVPALPAGVGSFGHRFAVTVRLRADAPLAHPGRRCLEPGCAGAVARAIGVRLRAGQAALPAAADDDPSRLSALVLQLVARKLARDLEGGDDEDGGALARQADRIARAPWAVPARSWSGAWKEVALDGAGEEGLHSLCPVADTVLCHPSTVQTALDWLGASATFVAAACAALPLPGVPVQQQGRTGTHGTEAAPTPLLFLPGQLGEPARAAGATRTLLRTTALLGAAPVGIRPDPVTDAEQSADVDADLSTTGAAFPAEQRTLAGRRTDASVMRLVRGATLEGLLLPGEARAVVRAWTVMERGSIPRAAWLVCRGLSAALARRRGALRANRGVGALLPGARPLAPEGFVTIDDPPDPAEAATGPRQARLLRFLFRRAARTGHLVLHWLGRNADVTAPRGEVVPTSGGRVLFVEDVVRLVRPRTAQQGADLNLVLCAAATVAHRALARGPAGAAVFQAAALGEAKFPGFSSVVARTLADVVASSSSQEADGPASVARACRDAAPGGAPPWLGSVLRAARRAVVGRVPARAVFCPLAPALLALFWQAAPPPASSLSVRVLGTGPGDLLWLGLAHNQDGAALPPLFDDARALRVPASRRPATATATDPRRALLLQVSLALAERRGVGVGCAGAGVDATGVAFLPDPSGAARAELAGRLYVQPIGRDTGPAVGPRMLLLGAPRDRFATELDRAARYVAAFHTAPAVALLLGTGNGGGGGARGTTATHGASVRVLAVSSFVESFLFVAVRGRSEPAPFPVCPLSGMAALLPGLGRAWLGAAVASGLALVVELDPAEAPGPEPAVLARAVEVASAWLDEVRQPGPGGDPAREALLVALAGLLVAEDRFEGAGPFLDVLAQPVLLCSGDGQGPFRGLAEFLLCAAPGPAWLRAATDQSPAALVDLLRSIEDGRAGPVTPPPLASLSDPDRGLLPHERGALAGFHGAGADLVRGWLRSRHDEDQRAAAALVGDRASSVVVPSPAALAAAHVWVLASVLGIPRIHASARAAAIVRDVRFFEAEEVVEVLRKLLELLVPDEERERHVARGGAIAALLARACGGKVTNLHDLRHFLRGALNGDATAAAAYRAWRAWLAVLFRIGAWQKDDGEEEEDGTGDVLAVALSSPFVLTAEQTAVWEWAHAQVRVIAPAKKRPRSPVTTTGGTPATTDPTKGKRRVFVP